VLRRFFGYQQRASGRPATNPVPAGERPGERLGAHHNPMEPRAVPRRRGPYRQKTPDRPPRWLPDQAWAALFAALGCDRDRAIFTMLVSSGARAEELCSMRGQDVDYGRQAIRLVGKGSRDERWVATSPESLTWLARYLAAGFAADPGEPLWWTVRGARRRLSYWTLRAVLARANRRLGSNWVLHDLRHTCAMRLANDPKVALVDLQAHLRHRQLSTTTERYLRPRQDEVIAHVQAHHQRRQQQSDPAGPASRPDVPGWAYDQGDLAVLFGGSTP